MSIPKYEKKLKKKPTLRSNIHMMEQAKEKRKSHVESRLKLQCDGEGSMLQLVHVLMVLTITVIQKEN